MSIKQKDMFSQNCAMRNILSRLCNKWSVLVLRFLNENSVLRFGELQKNIPEISPKLLTSTLRILEEDGLVSREVYSQTLPKVEYAITKKGELFFEKLVVFLDWTKSEIFLK